MNWIADKLGTFQNEIDANSIYLKSNYSVKSLKKKFLNFFPNCEGGNSLETTGIKLKEMVGRLNWFYWRFFFFIGIKVVKNKKQTNKSQRKTVMMILLSFKHE